MISIKEKQRKTSDITRRDGCADGGKRSGKADEACRGLDDLGSCPDPFMRERTRVDTGQTKEPPRSISRVRRKNGPGGTDLDGPDRESGFQRAHTERWALRQKIKTYEIRTYTRNQAQRSKNARSRGSWCSSLGRVKG